MCYYGNADCSFMKECTCVIMVMLHEGVYMCYYGNAS